MGLEFFPKALPSAVVDLTEIRPGGSREGFGSGPSGGVWSMEQVEEDVLFGEPRPLPSSATPPPAAPVESLSEALQA